MNCATYGKKVRSSNLYLEKRMNKTYFVILGLLLVCGGGCGPVDRKTQLLSKESTKGVPEDDWEIE